MWNCHSYSSNSFFFVCVFVFIVVSDTLQVYFAWWFYGPWAPEYVWYTMRTETHCYLLQPTFKKQPRLITSSVQRRTPENMFIILIEVFIVGWLPSGLPDVSLFTMVEADYDVPVHFSFTDSLVPKMCQTLRAIFSKARSTHNSTPMTVHADTTKPYDRQLTQCYLC